MKAIVIGIGNPFLKDDSVGLRIAEEVGRRLKVKVDFLTNTDFDIINKILGYDLAVIVDAIENRGNPGKIHVLCVEDLFRGYKFSGTHSLDLATSIKIGYEIFGSEMPRDVRIVAVEVEEIDFGYDCSESVKRAIPKAIEVIERLLKEHLENLNQLPADQKL